MTAVISGRRELGPPFKHLQMNAKCTTKRKAWCLLNASLAIAVICFTTLSTSIKAVAQTAEATSSQASKVQTSKVIELSLENAVILSGIHQFKENLKTLEKAGKGASIWITLPDDQGKLRESSVSPEFKKQLLDKDISAALDTMRQWDLEFKYPIRDQKVYIGQKEETTPDSLLFRAAMVNHLELARHIVDNYDVNPNNGYGRDSWEVTALIVATANEHGEMVELLLNAGANPNLKSGGGTSPLAQAVKNKDTQSTLALFQAGADFKQGFGPRGVNPKVLDELIREDKHEIVTLLLANGMEFKSPSSGRISITPLMQALANRRSQMALALLPNSDPRLYTDAPVARAQSGIDDIDVLPQSNALFLAQLRQSELDPAIEQAIEERIKILGGEEAVMLSRLQAAVAMSDFAYMEGRLLGANKILEKTLDNLSIKDIKEASDTDIAFTTKQILVKKHELSIINETEVSDRYKTLINELANLSEPMDHWHAMLDIINLAQSDDYETQLDNWQKRFAGKPTLDWDYSRLNNWIGLKDDESDKKRLYRALDYFEFSLSSSR